MKNQTHPSPPLSGREQSNFSFDSMSYQRNSPPDKGELEGVFFIPYNRKLTIYARENRKNPTLAEKKMWDILTKKQFAGLKFSRQKPLDNFIVDFYCSQLLLAIEIDGESHAEQELYDTEKSDILKYKYKIEIIRYMNSDVLKNSEGVYIDLLAHLEKRNKFLKQ